MWKNRSRSGIEPVAPRGSFVHSAFRVLCECRWLTKSMTSAGSRGLPSRQGPWNSQDDVYGQRVISFTHFDQICSNTTYIFHESLYVATQMPAAKSRRVTGFLARCHSTMWIISLFHCIPGFPPAVEQAGPHAPAGVFATVLREEVAAAGSSREPGTEPTCGKTSVSRRHLSSLYGV